MPTRVHKPQITRSGRGGIRPFQPYDPWDYYTYIIVPDVPIQKQ